jgi:hypothetical protein
MGVSVFTAAALSFSILGRATGTSYARPRGIKRRLVDLANDRLHRMSKKRAFR